MDVQDQQVLDICAEFDSRLSETFVSPNSLKLGDSILLSGKQELDGVIKFIGALPGKDGEFIGVDLIADGEGKHNGSFDGIQYFETRDNLNSGKFVRRSRISRANGNIVVKNMSELIEVPDTEMHGSLAQPDWKPPHVAVECNEDARPGYNSRPAHEYEDDPETLLLKVRALAELLQESKNCCLYSGAGLSTASGIDDYASKAGKKSKINVGRKKVKVGKNAVPNLGHRIFAKLANDDHIQSWVQQNHDGLPQKAGFPQHRINEIHGAWFDPSNPVVPMSGTLRGDLCKWLHKLEEESDLAIAVGTSLCGMSADAVVTSACERYNSGEAGNLGGVIVGLQQTQYDDISRLRIFARIDVVVALLAREMGIIIPALVTPYKPSVDPEMKIEEHVYRVPYDSEGNLTDDQDKMIVWDLRWNTKHVITDGPGKGFEATIHQIYHNRYACCTHVQRQGAENFGTGARIYSLGTWWLETATKGLWPKLPVVNKNPTLQINWGKL